MLLSFLASLPFLAEEFMGRKKGTPIRRGCQLAIGVAFYLSVLETYRAKRENTHRLATATGRAKRGKNTG